MSIASDKAITRLLNQFSDREKIKSILTSIIHQFDDSTDILNDLKSYRDLNTAEGIWLDIIGDIVGIPRPSEHLDDDFIFTYRTALEQLLRDLDCIVSGTVYNPCNGIVAPFASNEKRFEDDELHVRSYPSFSNYLSRSNEFQAYWTKAIAADQLIDSYILGPDGVALSASTFILDNTSGYHRFYLTPNTPSNYLHICLKQGGKRWTALQHTGLSNSVAWFDLELGVVGTKQASVESSSIHEIGNGWFLCKVTYSSVPSGGNFSIYAIASDGTVTASGDGSTPSIYMFGALAYVGVKAQLPLIKTSGASASTPIPVYEATNHGNPFEVPIKVTPLDQVAGLTSTKTFPIMTIVVGRDDITFSYKYDSTLSNYYWVLSGDGFDDILVLAGDSDDDMVPDIMRTGIEATFTFEKTAANFITVHASATYNETLYEETIEFEDPGIQIPLDFQWYVVCNGSLTGQWNCLIALGEEYDLGDPDKAYSSLSALDGGHYNSVDGLPIGVPIDDETYRFYINAKALATYKKPSVPDIYKFIRDTFDVGARIYNGDTGEIIVEISEFLTNQQRTLLQRYAPNAGGSILWVINWPVEV